MNIKHTKIHRIRITGPREESDEAFDYALRNGYRVIRCGPMVMRGSGRADLSRFAITAEREEKHHD